MHAGRLGKRQLPGGHQARPWGDSG